MGLRWHLPLAVTVLAVVLAGCSTSAAEPARPATPITVTSVDSWAAMTLSTGDRIFDIDSGGPNSDTCQADYLTGQARSLLVGRQVTGYTPASSSPYATAPAGYRYGRFSYAGAPDAWQDVLDTSSGAALRACSPVVEEAPLSSATPAPGSDRVDVDVHHDGNARDGRLTGGYCAHKWWC